MKHSFPWHKSIMILSFTLVSVIQASGLYQVYDVQAVLSNHASVINSERKAKTGLLENDASKEAGKNTKIAGNTDNMDNTENAENIINIDNTVISNNTASLSGTEKEETILRQLKKTDWNLILVNKQHPIPQDYSFTLGKINGSMKCDIRILTNLRKMMEAAKDDGVTLVIKSPYRNEQRQRYLFNKKIKSIMKKNCSYLIAYQQAAQAVTLPGSSEHEIGLALDIVSNHYSALEVDFSQTDAGKWLAAHSHEYGFILRYPKGKEDITGIEFEPWHFRYVGVLAATYMYEKQLTLEELIQLL